MVKKKKKMLDKFTDAVEKKLDNLTMQDTIEIIVFMSTTVVVYNTILNARDAVKDLVDDFLDKQEDPPPAWLQIGLSFSINPFFGILADLLWKMQLIPETVPEPVPDDAKMAVKGHILGISVFIAYLLVYRPEVVTAILGGAVDVVSGLTTNIMKLMTTTTLIK